MSKKQKTADDVINDLRKARAEVAKERAQNPKKFFKESQQLIEKLGMKKSKLKPIKIDFSKGRTKYEDVA